MDDSIRQLCAGIASGDAEAFSRLYRERFDWMFAEARRVTRRDESFCLDVVQDAMMKVIRSIPALNDEPSLLSWLRAVVRTCAYDRLRSEARRARRDERAAAARREAVDPGERLADAERLEWLRQELATLDPAHMSLVRWRYRLGWTLTRIGRAAGISSSAADGRIGRTVDHLAARAKEHFDE